MSWPDAGTDRALDTIVVTAFAEDEIEADSADVYVCIKGSSYFTGMAALQKAHEVRDLVAALAPYVRDEKSIQLREVRTEVSTGTLTKSSSAYYTLRVRCDDLERLGDIIAVVSSQRNSTLQSVQWRYTEAVAAERALLERCLAEASAKAETIARGLGVHLAAVHRVSEDGAGARPQDVPMYGAPMPVASRARGMTGEDFGLQMSHAKRVALQIRVEYRIDGTIGTSRTQS